MKLLFTSTLVLMLTLVQGMPLPNDSTDKGKKEQVNGSMNPLPNPSTSVSIASLQQENAQLKVQLAAMENSFEEEKSGLQYKITMLTILNKLDIESRIQSMEDLKSKVSFGETMSNTLLILKKVMNP